MSLEGKTPEEIASYAALADQLQADPRTREGFLRLAKTVNPDAAIPEIDMPARMAQQFKPMFDELNALKEQMARRDIEDKVKANRKAALSVDGVSRADLPAIEKLMVEKQIPDHKTAAEFFALQNRAADPTPANQGTTRTFGAPKLPDLKEFGGNQLAWARKTAAQAIDEFRGRRPS
jgi:hypothetical protein